MYTAVAYTIATYSGMSYPDFVKERIFKPLGMSTTTFSRAEAANTGLLTHGWSSQGRRLPYWLSDEKIDVLGGPGGIISSSVDMVSMLTLRNVKWLNQSFYTGQVDQYATGQRHRGPHKRYHYPAICLRLCIHRSVDRARSTAESFLIHSWIWDGLAAVFTERP